MPPSSDINPTKNKKHIGLIIFLFVILLLVALVFYFYSMKNSSNSTEDVETKTYEEMKQEVRDYKPDPAVQRNPELLKQELVNYKPPKEESGPSEEEMLNELRNAKP
jgi:flagellar biosynthesis/type III secretory pathway M-ring protein FliF/YscJ